MVKNCGSSSEKTKPLKKGAWSSEEDRKLINYIKKYKIWNWSEMSKAAGLARSGKSCRLRWVNYLRPDIKHGNFSNEEVQTIMTLHQTLGNRWASIASKLPGRTDNEVKNYWHTHLKKRLINKPTNNVDTNHALIKPTELDSDQPQQPLRSSDSGTIILDSPRPMSVDDFPPPSPPRPQPLSTNNREQDHADYNTNSASETFGQSSQQQQQQQLDQGLDGDHHHGNGGLHVAQDYSLATLLDWDSHVGPTAGSHEFMWHDHDDQSMWTYDHFYGDVYNDWLDYMDPIF